MSYGEPSPDGWAIQPRPSRARRTSRTRRTASRCLGRGLPVLQGRCDRERERVLLARVCGHGLERPRLPLRPVPTPRLEPTVFGVVHPRPGGCRRVHPAAPRRPGPSSTRPPADAVPAELLRSSGTAVGAPTRPASGSNRRSAHRPADHDSADLRSDHLTRPTGCPGDGGAAHGCQEALPELRDDGQRGQHVLLLLREPIPLSRNTIGPLLTRTDCVPPSRGMPRAPYVRCL